MSLVLYSLQSIYSTSIRRCGTPRKVLTARCDFYVRWFVTKSPSISNNPPVIRDRSSTLAIYTSD
ncbi:unnamed protein product [Schistosoma margrebowiei]|uniref:Uncharacterized protein n=1 Tax=Schistosoma margrebowiei TaxID=48269 RepID=A0A183N9G4_9TREM|nr:unnamed protein product [Schistosoma margrebowiei]